MNRTQYARYLLPPLASFSHNSLIFPFSTSFTLIAGTSQYDDNGSSLRQFLNSGSRMFFWICARKMKQFVLSASPHFSSLHVTPFLHRFVLFTLVLSLSLYLSFPLALSGSPSFLLSRSLKQRFTSPPPPLPPLFQPLRRVNTLVIRPYSRLCSRWKGRVGSIVDDGTVRLSSR